MHSPSGAKRKGSGGVWEECEVRNQDCESGRQDGGRASTVSGAEATSQGGAMVAAASDGRARRTAVSGRHRHEPVRGTEGRLWPDA